MRETTRHAATGLVLAALMCASLPVASAAAPKHSDNAGAHAAVAKVHALAKGKGVKTGFELTPALAQLSASLPSLTGSDRDQAESLLARPDDTQQDPADTHKWTVPEAPGSPYCLAHFCVHWVAASADAPALTSSNLDPAPDYVEQMAAILENEVFPCENGTAPAACAGAPGLGWREAAPDSGRGGNDKTDVYIEDLYTNEHVFGYAAADPGQAQDPSVPHSAYMVVDKDYSRYANGDAAGGLAAERVTAAHEYNHVLQNAYDYLEDSWMFEATAVYMEDKVYPQINDYLDYVRAWASSTKQPLTTFSQTSLKAYGSAVWNHWLDHRFGAGVVRSAWEHSVGAADFAPGAYGAAIAGANGAGFSDEFDRFSAAVAEWNVPGGGFPDPYPDVPRDGTLPAGSQTTPFALPHTTFALFDVPIPQTGAPVIRLTATLPPDTTGAVALVGREGADPSAGTVTSNLTSIPAGGIGAVDLNSPGSFGRITAVVVNSDPSKGGFDFTADDYVFTKDAQDVVASVAEPGPPIVTTGGPGSVTDHGAVVGGALDPHLIETTWTIEYGRTSSYGSSTAPQRLLASTVGAAPVTAALSELRANTTYHYRVLASNTAGAAAGADMTFKTKRDVTRPGLSVKVKRQKLRTVRTRGALYLARCSERCLGTAELRLSRATARKLGLSVVLGKSRVTLDARPASTKLRVRLSPGARRKLAGNRGGLRLTLRVSVADEARNRSTRTKRLVVKP
jgi:hypothetical protein